MIDGIMKEERGIALRLLYQLKMSLEKVYPPTDVTILKKTGKIGDTRPALKLGATKEKFEEQAATFFHQRLQVLNKPQKQIIMEKHLKKYDDEQDKQDSFAKQGDRDEQSAKERALLDMRSAQINKVARNAGFMEEWLQKGVQDWQKNQTLKKDRERKDLEFEYKETEKYHQLALTKIEEASKEVNDGIALFERNLKNNYGIETKVKKQDAERAISESIQNGSPMRQTTIKNQRFSSSITAKGSNPFAATLKTTGGMAATAGLAMTLTSTGLRSKDKKVISEGQRKDRDRRRRKMVVDQMKTYQEMEIARRQDQVLERMKRQSKQEEELDYEKWRTEQCKNVIIDNRKLREARYDKRREFDTQTSAWREEEMLKTMKDQMAREVETLKNRDEEMRILGKQAHRERRNEFGAVLFDAIFEIANEAYIHQQKQDSSDIDSRNWHEWLQLFIEEMPIEGTLSKLAELKDHNDDVHTEDEVFLTQTKGDPHDKLDQMELVDYLKNLGQWPKELISDNPPNLEQFLTGQSDSQPAAAAAKGGAKGAPAKAATEQITLEDGDAELPSEVPNNFQLGDAVEQIINLNYEARALQQRPKMPQHLSIKMCFIGYAFAGKKTQATLLKDLYGLQTYQMSDLVNEALAYFESNPEPILNNHLEVIDETMNNDAVSDDSEMEQEINAEEDFRLCGEKIANLLSEGKEIPDEVYVQLYVAKLRLTYPHKSKKQLRKELKIRVEKQRAITKKIEPFEKELQELQEAANAASEDVASPGNRKKKNAKDPIHIQAKIDELNEEISKLDIVEKNGWILLDFPSTFAQAKLMETGLSGFLPKQECDSIDREKQTEDAFLLVQPTAKEELPKTLIKSGLDAIIWFDLSREECMRRALGRRFDSQEGSMYHIEDIPPSTNEAPLCERLQGMDEDQNSEATLIDRWMSFDQGARALETWLLRFGDSSSAKSILYKLDASSQQSTLANEINNVVEDVLAAKKARDSVITQRINAILEETEVAESKRAQKQAEEEEERKRREEEGGPGLEGGAPEVKKEDAKVERPEPATERVPAKEPGVLNIDNEFKPTIIKVWQELSQNYKGQMKKVFRQVRIQRERITESFSHTQNKYMEFIYRPDTKQEKLEQFIKDFNDFSDQFPDLREDEFTKDELHQRVDTLSDELWEIIEERKEQHIEERKKIMESGWIEHELTFLVNSAQSLMQAEVDKFKSSIQVLQDFYHAFEDKLIPEPPGLVTQELIAEGEELPPVETLTEGADISVAASYTYPRLDKIFEKALKTQFVVDVSLNAAGQDKKGGAAPPKGKDPKKPAEDEKPIEETQHVRDMRNSIKVEKSILRFRLTQIRNWALKRLRDSRTKAIKVYTKMDDWIHVANKAENDAVDEMCVVVKCAIEEERKIQDELRVNFMDFCVDEKIMNFIEPVAEKLPAMEQVRRDRFSISQLKTLVSELDELAKQHGDGNGGIPNKIIIDLLIRKLENSKTLSDNGSLPEEWWGLTEYDFQNMVRNLDRSGQGVVSWKQLATYIILLKSPLPSDKDIENYRKNFNSKSGANSLLSLSDFTQIQSWFDANEFSKDRDYSISFPRVNLIKELLFNVTREHALPQGQQNQERVSFEEIAQILSSAKKIVDANILKKGDIAVAAAVKTFGDVLLMQANQPSPNI